MPVNRKVRHRISRLRLADGREVVLFPILDEKSGKLHEFIALDYRSSERTGMHSAEQDVYLRAD